MAGSNSANEVWITGIGLVSSLGADTPTHVERLFSNGPAQPVVDEARYAPYTIHPLTPLDFSAQIPKKSDQRQMEPWQRIGVYAAGLALSDANIASDHELLDRTNLVVAAGSGERDTKIDCDVLDKLAAGGDTALLAKEVLPSALRPTLFLAQLSNMLAGNISIVHNVTGSSRTFMGEEMAGLAAIENSFRRIAAGQADLILVGGALNAEREDLLLGYELGHNLWRGPFRPVSSRSEGGGGFVAGSMGAFIVLESSTHAQARGTDPYARIAGVVTERTRRMPGDVTHALTQGFAELSHNIPSGPLPVFCGASGVEAQTTDELLFLDNLSMHDIKAVTRIYGDLLGHGVEAHFPVGLALAALALKEGALPISVGSADIECTDADPVERALVTGVGHWRGEGLALVEQVS